MNTPQFLGSMTIATVLAALTGFALRAEGATILLSVTAAAFVWWHIGLLYAIRYK